MCHQLPAMCRRTWWHDSPSVLMRFNRNGALLCRPSPSPPIQVSHLTGLRAHWHQVAQAATRGNYGTAAAVVNNVKQNIRHSRLFLYTLNRAWRGVFKQNPSVSLSDIDSVASTKWLDKLTNPTIWANVDSWHRGWCAVLVSPRWSRFVIAITSAAAV